MSNAAEGTRRLQGKAALITGASRGIGRAVALAYAAEGARLVIAGRDKESLQAVAEEIRSLGASVCAARVDLADADSAAKLVDAAHHAFGRVDILVNNAAILGPRENLFEYPLEAWQRVMEVNFNGLFRVTKEALGKMISQHSGAIINVVGSPAEGETRWGAYGVSKLAVEGMSRVLAQDLAPHGIRVNCIDPGPVRTALRAEAYPAEDPSRVPTPDKVTNAFVYLASDASKGMTGARLDAQEWANREF